MSGPRWCPECKFRRWPGECNHSAYSQPTAPAGFSDPLSERTRKWLEARERKVREEWKNGLLPMGFGENVRPHTSITIITRPQLPMRPIMLEIEEPNIDCFLIEDIRIGKNSQFVTPQGVHASIFRERDLREIYGNLPGFDVLQVGLDFSIRVMNQSDETRRFAGCVFGQGLPEPKQPPTTTKPYPWLETAEQVKARTEKALSQLRNRKTLAPG